MLPTGGDYGDRKALAEQQSAAPISPQGAGSAGGGGTPPVAATRRAGRTGAMFGEGGIFSATQRPGEPMTAGVDMGAGEGAPMEHLPSEPYLVAKALLQLSPTPEMERLVARIARA